STAMPTGTVALSADGRLALAGQGGGRVYVTTGVPAAFRGLDWVRSANDSKSRPRPLLATLTCRRRRRTSSPWSAAWSPAGLPRRGGRRLVRRSMSASPPRRASSACSTALFRPCGPARPDGECHRLDVAGHVAVA